MTRQLACLVLFALLSAMCSTPLRATDLAAEHHAARRVLKQVLPSYPDLARRLHMKGIVKLQLIVQPDGTVKSSRVLGGNPAFVEAALQVINKWKFEPASKLTTESVELRFEPPQ